MQLMGQLFGPCYPKHSPHNDIPQGQLANVKGQYFSEMFKSPDSCLQKEIHMETDQSRAVLVKERTEGWESLLLPLPTPGQLPKHLHGRVGKPLGRHYFKRRPGRIPLRGRHFY